MTEQNEKSKNLWYAGTVLWAALLSTIIVWGAADLPYLGVTVFSMLTAGAFFATCFKNNGCGRTIPYIVIVIIIFNVLMPSTFNTMSHWLVNAWIVLWGHLVGSSLRKVLKDEPEEQA